MHSDSRLSPVSRTTLCVDDNKSGANIGLFDTVEGIQRQISDREKRVSFDDILYFRKKQLGMLDHYSIEPMGEMTEEEINNYITRSTNLVDGVLIFQEFIKEYTVLGAQQKHSIKMTNM